MTVPAAPPVSVTAAPSAASDAMQPAVSAYLGMWQRMVAAAETSNWQDPSLAQYATGDALQVITKSLYTDHLNGAITKGQPKNSPHPSTADNAADPSTVLISDCGDDSGWLKYRADTGQPADNEPGGRRSITAEVRKQSNGQWRVARFAVEAAGTC